ncbi:MAG: PilZ domain-containing protein [Bryobacteraceae bacterium]
MDEIRESETGWSSDPLCDGAALATPGPVNGGFSSQHHSDGLDLGDATKRIADALQGALAHVERAVFDRADSDRSATKATFDQLSGEVREFGRQLSEVRAEVKSAAQYESETRSMLAVRDERLSQLESELRAAQDSVVTLTDARRAMEERTQELSNLLATMETRITALTQTVEGLDKSLQSYGEAARGTSDLCERVVDTQESLNARLDEHSATIEQLTADAAHRGKLIDNLVSSLRTLDGRRGSRQVVNREVRVVTIDEKEVSIGGVVVDVSDSGLGVRLAAPVPMHSRLRLDIEGTRIVGEVAYCRKQGALHRIGLKSVCEESDRPKVEE